MVLLLDAVSRESHPQAADVTLFPIVLCHFLPVGPEPGQVFDLGAVNAAALEKLSAAKDRMGGAQHDQGAGKGEQGLLLARDVPVEPADLVVLTIRVVVPALRSADFVASANHRHALR